MYDLLDKIIPYLFMFSFVAMLLVAVQALRRTRSKVKEAEGKVRYVRPYPFITLALFLGSLLCVFAVSEAIKREAHREISDWIAHVDRPTFTATVNGKPNQSGYLLDALTDKGEPGVQHMGPTDRLRITLKDKNGELDLELGRNPVDRTKYWVFYPRYRNTLNNAVYYIKTIVFATYWP